MMKDNMLAWLREGDITIPGALLTGYRRMNLNEQELVLLLHFVSFQQKGNDFPTPTELSERMTIPASECSEILHTLIQRGFIEIIDGYNAEGIRFEKYSLQPLWNKLVDQFLIDRMGRQEAKHQEDETNLYTCFENEFGRPLSPFECETLALWLDDDRHDPILIKAALKEAVISGILNFRYIDRILFEWKKNGIKTVEQAKNQGRKFRQYQMQQKISREEQRSSPKSVPFYNWLEQ